MTAPRWLDPLLGNLGDIAGELEHRGGAVAALQRVRNPRRASVLILFDGDPSAAGAGPPEDATVLLTQRASAMRQHAGQVAFPGGARDPEDADDVAVALREAEEETGLDPAAVQVLAELDPIEVPVSGFRVVPVIGFAASPPDVRAVDPAETALVRRVPLAELIDPAHRFMVRKSFYRGPAFAAGPMLVWGFTGGLLNALISAAGWERPWNTDDVRPLTDEVHAAAARAQNWQESPR
ncbi:coenzyme A pyrophosphatase [Tsukamurella pulmonis]|uniref:ADP-ribose pyrophosphatase YjhB, NUDIX family n=1 Tax=Tsukamurella pulmonis TaxID=47312 RepID=A0A1H1BB10_9ACTN|nr:CoA pyrophosphatase [Tsukamurella pulmonis]KXO94083.1 coenzyme A pyrophosphatase [Tsukamurella pulmonis]KXP11915.1 coenzyme A pyrophosphatase [Tsukamurella pulmonis]SDQ49077.1 ADP-ribose pyrophosphatase YjhB, NUDIX family [Tsukamurella pulmonis]SUP25396.1 putative NUDIX hydrolase [Tsukamurella pulmonis]